MKTRTKPKLKRPEPFGPPGYPAFDIYVGFGTVQVVPVRPNVALYGSDFKKFSRWLERVKKYAAQFADKKYGDGK